MKRSTSLLVTCSIVRQTLRDRQQAYRLPFCRHFPCSCLHARLFVAAQTSPCGRGRQCSLIAILTTQMSLLDFTETKNTDIYNAFSGIAVGLFIALSALYVFFAPRISLVGRESNVFVGEGTQTVATDGQGNVKILLVSSRVYGSYVYVAKLDGKTLSGEIRQEASLWKKMHVALKILCCVLSEILIFVWLAGYLVFFLRCINLPAQLERKMKTLNFSKPDLQKTISSQCAIAETPDM